MGLTEENDDQGSLAASDSSAHDGARSLRPPGVFARWRARSPRARKRQVWIIPATLAWFAVGTATGGASGLPARGNDPLAIVCATLQNARDAAFALVCLVGLFVGVLYAVHTLVGTSVTVGAAPGHVHVRATLGSIAACAAAALALMVTLTVCAVRKPELLLGWTSCWFVATLVAVSQLWLARDRLPADPDRRVGLLVLCTFLTLVLGLWLVILRPEVVVFARPMKGVVWIVRVLAVGITIIGTAVIKAAIRDMSDAPIDIDAQWRQVLRAENRWLAARRVRTGLPTAGDARAAPPDVIGLALSGGGIRAATISLGFLQGLSRRRLLRRFDYLSSVSGGGWAAGAFAVAMSEESFAPFPARAGSRPSAPTTDAPLAHEASPDFWSRLVERFRSHGDYLVPGGIGFGAATFAPVVALLFGALLNALPLGLLILALACLVHDTDANGWVGGLVGWVRGSHLIPTRLFVAYDERKHAFRGIPAFDLVTIFGVLVALALALSLAWMFVTYLRGRASRTIRAVMLTTSLGLALGVTSIVWLALHDARSFIVTASVIGATAGLAVAFPRLGAKHLASIASGMVVGHATALSIATYDHAVLRAAERWTSAIDGVLRVPGGAQKFIVQVLHLPTASAPLVELGVVSLLAVAATLFLNRNTTGLHAFWTRQIRSAFLGPHEDGPADWPLSALRPRSKARSRDDRAARNGGGALAGAPLHIVSCAVNVPGTLDALRRTRRTDRFEMTPYYVGGPATGWAPTACYGAALSYADAVAISAAAVNAQGGETVPRGARGALAALNLRLGVWLDNPRTETKNRDRDRARFWSIYAAQEMLGRNSERDAMVLVSDGGHHENLGVEPLVARGCRVIVALDAGADPTWRFCDLARLVRLLRVPAGWTLTDLDEASMYPTDPRGRWPDRCVGSAVSTAWLRRAGSPSIRLLVVKSALLASMPLEVREYAERNPLFPQQSTAEQFFDWTRFETHRLLGECLADEIDAAEIETPAVMPGVLTPAL